jgi:hypothetical protein
MGSRAEAIGDDHEKDVQMKMDIERWRGERGREGLGSHGLL